MPLSPEETRDTVQALAGQEFQGLGTALAFLGELASAAPLVGSPQRLNAGREEPRSSTQTAAEGQGLAGVGSEQIEASAWASCPS